jgi:hypothetical protein
MVSINSASSMTRYWGCLPDRATLREADPGATGPSVPSGIVHRAAPTDGRAWPGLRGQEPVERIAVVEREARHAGDVPEVDGEHRDAVGDGVPDARY